MKELMIFAAGILCGAFLVGFIVCLMLINQVIAR